MRLPVLLMLAGLAACQDAGGDAATAPAVEPPLATSSTSPASATNAPAASPAPVALALDAEGLRFVVGTTGSTSLLAFGAARSQVEQAMANAQPGVTPATSQNAECGAGPMQFADYAGLSLNYQDDVLVGWFAREGATASTMNGIANGMSRAALEDSGSTVVMNEGSTLGEEFMLGAEQPAIGGFLSGPGTGATVTGLFAGTNCFFR